MEINSNPIRQDGHITVYHMKENAFFRRLDGNKSKICIGMENDYLIYDIKKINSKYPTLVKGNIIFSINCCRFSNNGEKIGFGTTKNLSIVDVQRPSIFFDEFRIIENNTEKMPGIISLDWRDTSTIVCGSEIGMIVVGDLRFY